MAIVLSDNHCDRLSPLLRKPWQWRHMQLSREVSWSTSFLLVRFITFLFLFFSNWITVKTVVHVPKWFPGAGWKDFAETGRLLTNEMVNTPFEITVKSMVNTYPLSKYSHVTNITLRKPGRTSHRSLRWIWRKMRIQILSNGVPEPCSLVSPFHS